MPAKIKDVEFLKQKKFQESTDVDNSLLDYSDQNESEITWIKLHRMFDK